MEGRWHSYSSRKLQQSSFTIVQLDTHTQRRKCTENPTTYASAISVRLLAFHQLDQLQLFLPESQAKIFLNKDQQIVM